MLFRSETALGSVITLLFFFWVTPSLVHAWRDPVPDEVSEEMRRALRALKETKRELRREFRGLSKKGRSPRGLKVAVNGRLVKGAPAAKKRAKPVKKGKRS